MKLIYAYIEDYRTFEDCGINFSNQFNIKYDKNNSKLEIIENPKYIGIYPNHINDINAVVGKNSTGKTSLLELIGKKISRRLEDNEILLEDYIEPHENINILNVKPSKGEGLKYSTSYFLIYFYGKSESGNNIYVLETPCSDKYKRFFDNFSRRYQSKSMYDTNQWGLFYFEIKNDKLFIIDKKPKYNSVAKIISFGEAFFDNGRGDMSYDNYAVKREYEDSNNATLYNGLLFLRDLMKKSTDENLTMFQNDSYKVNLIFKHGYSELIFQNGESVIKDYRDYDLSLFTCEEKIVLAFMNWFIIWVLVGLIIENKHYTDDIKKDCIDQLKNLNHECQNYNDIKNIYYGQLKSIVNIYNNNLKKSFGEPLKVKDFQNAVMALEDFFVNANKQNIKYEYSTGKISITINKKSKIEKVKSLFTDLVDLNIKDTKKSYFSIVDGFIDYNIECMSSGEKETWALYTAINENIKFEYNKFDSYILIFDEIEKSMHPEMCRCLIYELIKFLKNYTDKKFQIIIGSHSPFILSDIPSENVICIDKKDNKTVVSKSEDKTFAQNIHTLLKSTFFVEKTMGAYSLSLISLLLELMDDTYYNSKIGSEEMDSIAYSLTKRFKSVEESRQFTLYVINQIGEPVLRKVLMDKYNDTIDINEQIRQKEEELNELKAKRDRQE